VCPSQRSIDPAGTKTRETLLNRIARLREELESLPLSEFTVADLPTLCRILGIGVGPLDYPGTRDLEWAERRVKEIQFRKLWRKT